MSTPLKNIIANYGSRVWAMVAMYLFTPVYIQLLGIESFAIISFYNVLFGFIVFADAGIASAMDREFAKAGTNEYKVSILKVFERIYAGVCIFLGLSLYLLSEYIAINVLNANEISEASLRRYIQMIGIGVSIQLMPTVYLGALMGAQKQVAAGIIQFVWQSSKSIGGILLLYFVENSLELFFTWQIICNVAVVFVSRSVIMRSFPVMGRLSKLNFLTVPKDIWTYIGGMFFISVLSAVSLQIDKILVSKLVSLENYGYYSLATILGQIPFLATIPIVFAVFPFMTRSISENGMANLYPVFRRFSFIISAVIMPLCILLVLYGGDLFGIWQGGLHLESSASNDIANLIALLVIGNFLLALQQLPYYFLLAKGKTIYSIIQNTLLVILIVPALYLSISKFGFLGTGIPIIFLQFGGFLYLLAIIRKEYKGIDFANFLMLGYILPFVVTCVISFSTHYIFVWAEMTNYTVFCCVSISALATIGNFVVFRMASGEKLSHKTLF